MSRTSSETMAQEFLQIRAKILEIAAFYDRLDRDELDESAAGALQLLTAGCAVLIDEQPDKAARVQLLFSRQYDAQWRQQFDI